MQVSKQFKLHKACDNDKGSLRPALQSIHFDGKNLVATNGHILAVVKPEIDKNDKPGNIPMKAFIEASKIGTKKENAKLTTTEHQVKIGENGNGQAFDLILDKFPDWQAVMPSKEIKEKPVFKLRFNVDNLKRLTEAMGSTTGIVTLYFSNENMDDHGYLTCERAIPITVDDAYERSDNNSQGILMPVRTY